MSINDRFKTIRSSLGISQADFGKQIGVSRDTVANIEGSRIDPKDIHILSVCMEYGVNEAWLQTGEGEMFNQLSRKEQIAAFFADVETDPDDSFRVKIIEALAKMTVEDWEYLGAMLKRLTEEAKEES